MPTYPATKAGLGLATHRLHGALAAAGLPVQTVMQTGPDAVNVVSPTAGLQSAIDTVLATFDPAAETAAELAADADVASLSDLTTMYQNMLDGLTTIAGHMDQITAGPASPTAAQTGTALKLIAGDVKTMTQGQTRFLKAIAVLVRRLGAG